MADLVLGVSEAEMEDEEAARLWSSSGARWLTHPEVAVPGKLVRRVVGLVGDLDSRGAKLAELVSADGVGFLAERAALMGLPSARDHSAGGASGFVRCNDGWLALSLAREEDIAALPAWLEDDVGSVDPDNPWLPIRAAAFLRSCRDLAERGVLLGLPCSVVGEVGNDRPVIAERLGSGAPGSLAGAVVVNLASLWAGPLCADVLARMGCRVITVESTRRPDGGRRARRFFDALHGRTESLALDLADDSGQAALRQVLERADVVIEGSRPRALEQMSIDAREIVAHGPRVWVSITSHGRSSAEGARVGFGDDAAAAGGLVGWVGPTPRFIADAVADPLTGLTAAHAIAHLVEVGGRWLADVALARVAGAAAGEWIAAPDGNVERPRPRSDVGAGLPLGRDTMSVLSSLGVAADGLGRAKR